jgi:hypothetical protein
MTTTTQLRNILERIRVSGSTFTGIFARDTLPSTDTITNFPSYLIVNTDLSSGVGIHWVALYYITSTEIEGFDSYGLNPSMYGINVTCTLTNSKRLQGEKSTVCGQYCAFYLYYRLRGYSLQNIISSFSIRDFMYNDRQVAKFIRNHFNICNKLSRCTGEHSCISRCKCISPPLL